MDHAEIAARAEAAQIAAACRAAEARVLAAFPDRPMLEVHVCQQSSGAYAVYAGKATRMRRVPGRGQPTPEAAADAAIAKLRAE